MDERIRTRPFSRSYGSSVSEVRSVRCSSEEKLERATDAARHSVEALSAALFPARVDEEKRHDENHQSDHRENEQEEEGECAHAFAHHHHCNTKSTESMWLLLSWAIYNILISFLELC